MVKLRLRRIGKKKAPVYKIVAADSRAPRDGRFIESVGLYNPNLNPAQIDLKEERVFHWLKNGATPTVTVKNLLSSKGLMLKLHLTKKGADADKINVEYNKWLGLQEAKINTAAEKKVRRSQKKKKISVKTEHPKASEQTAPTEQTAPVEQTVNAEQTAQTEQSA